MNWLRVVVSRVPRSTPRINGGVTRSHRTQHLVWLIAKGYREKLAKGKNTWDKVQRKAAFESPLRVGSHGMCFAAPAVNCDNM